MTIRSISKDLAAALDIEKRRRNLSLNRTVLAVLHEGLGLDRGGIRSNGLGGQAGTWSDREYQLFVQAVMPLRQVDDEIWR